MLSHIETQKLNEELKTIRNTIGFLSHKRSKRAKEETAQLEARREEINKALEDAPPTPLSPEEIWGNIEWWAKRHIKNEAEIKEKFLEKFTGSPHWAMGSYGQDLIIAERMAAQSLKILEVGMNIPDLMERVTEMLKLLAGLANDLRDTIIRETRSGYMRSTNSMGNILTLWEMEATAKLYDELRGSWAGLHIDSYAASLQSWKELQLELEALVLEEKEK